MSNSRVVGPDGTSFDVTTHGDRSDPAVMLIMGHSASKSKWSRLVHEFSGRGFFVVTWDNRGAGATRVPGQELFVPKADGTDIADQALFTYGDMAEDVIVLMDHFGIDSAHIAGASMGGQIATICGIRHPSRCLSLSEFLNAIIGVASTPRALIGEAF